MQSTQHARAQRECPAHCLQERAVSRAFPAKGNGVNVDEREANVAAEDCRVHDGLHEELVVVPTDAVSEPGTFWRCE